MPSQPPSLQQLIDEGIVKAVDGRLIQVIDYGPVPAPKPKVVDRVLHRGQRWVGKDVGFRDPDKVTILDMDNSKLTVRVNNQNHTSFMSRLAMVSWINQTGAICV